MTNTEQSNWVRERAVVADIIAAERLKQLEKWGVQYHELPVYLTILIEEVGELAQQLLNQKFNKSTSLDVEQKISADLQNEAVQTAAVAAAIVQRIIYGSA